MTDLELGAETAATAATGRSRQRVVTARVTSVLAALFVLAALALPAEFGHLTPLVFLTIPVEAVVGIAVVLVLPARARPVVAMVGGAVLGLVTLLKLLDLGFDAALARPFDLLSDWPLLISAREFVTRSYGGVSAVVALVAVVLLAVAVPVLMALAVRRLSRVVASRRAVAGRAAVVLGAGWVALAALGVHAMPGVPVAGRHSSEVVAAHVAQVRADINDPEVFAGQLAADTYRDTPAGRLLTALRGKDVVVAFVESYGRSAIEHRDIAPRIDALLDAGTQRLAVAGFPARSAFLTSSTIGGGSWYAHSTLQSGLWVDSQRRYSQFLNSDRLTLTGMFRRAGWRTVAVMPANDRDWPEGAVYGYHEVYDARTLGYKGPRVGFSATPDQYTLSAFQRLERAKPGRRPVMAQIDLVSSHSPWTRVPTLVDWSTIGDGSGFAVPAGAGEARGSNEGRKASRVRADYARSVEYSLASLISYVETYGDENLVLVLLGDHQPAPVVTGANPGRDVPVTVITHDRAVLDRISGWGWQDGLNPARTAPVWRMDTFRDRFLAAFGK